MDSQNLTARARVTNQLRNDNWFHESRCDVDAMLAVNLFYTFYMNR